MPCPHCLRKLHCAADEMSNKLQEAGHHCGAVVMIALGNDKPDEDLERYFYCASHPTISRKEIYLHTLFILRKMKKDWQLSDVE